MDDENDYYSNRLLIFANPEKARGRPSGKHPGLPHWPYRLLLCGSPGCGKRSQLLNLIMRHDPVPSAFHIVHADPDTIEYDCLKDLGSPIYFYTSDDLPTAQNIRGETPGGDREVHPTPVTEETIGGRDESEAPLVIIDEVTSDMIRGDNKVRIERLMNYLSSHFNTSVAICSQSIVNLPPKVRRAFSHFVLYKQPSDDANSLAASRSGIPLACLKELFELCRSRHDSIMVDSTRNPEDRLRFRLNLFEPIEPIAAVASGNFD